VRRSGTGSAPRGRPEVPFTSICASDDRAVPARSSIDRYTANVAVDTGHLGLLTTLAAFAAVAAALTAPPRVGSDLESQAAAATQAATKTSCNTQRKGSGVTGLPPRFSP
jgi:hypothetical protein